MDIGAAVAAITALAGVVLGAIKIGHDQAAIRRLERLAALQESVPENSIARANVNEALDWQSLEVVQRERNPRPVLSVAVGFSGYLVGIAGTILFSVLFFQGLEDRQDGRMLLILGLGIAASVGLAAISILLIFGPRRVRKRHKTLSSLDELERKEIIATHKRHDVD